VGDELNRPLTRDAHVELAAVAADVVTGLQQLVEADQPLTAEVIQIWCTWPRRVYRHETAAATSAAERVAAAERYWQQAGEPYRMFRSMCDGDHSLEPMAEYAMRGSELALAAVGAQPPATDAYGRSGRSGRPLPVIARDVWDWIQRRINDEPLTPEFAREICECSRGLCIAESATAKRAGERLEATTAHAQRTANVFSFISPLHTSDGPAPRSPVQYYLAEAKLWAVLASPHSRQQLTAHRQEMTAAALGKVHEMSRRKGADEPLTIEFVEEMCVWSRKLWLAEERERDRKAIDPAPRVEHLRRMRDLHADLKKRFDEGGDVSWIQLSQSAYFLREAELSGSIPDDD